MMRISTSPSSRCVAQRMRTDPPGDPGRLGGLDDDAVELPGADRLQRVLAREQPALAVLDGRGGARGTGSFIVRLLG